MIKKIRKYNTGMTILELIVVLGIFALLATVSIFNYNGFQSKIDVANLADDIALQVVQAQNASLSGFLPTQTPTTSPVSSWKPSYGVYFSSTATADLNGADNKHFFYFADLDNKNDYDTSTCSLTATTGECLSKYTITNNNSISSLNIFYTDGTDACSTNCPTNLTITFARPSSGAVVYTSLSTTTPLANSSFKYVEITITNKQGNASSAIDLYPSGRVQMCSKTPCST